MPTTPDPDSNSARPYIDQALRLLHDWAQNHTVVTTERLDDLTVLVTQALARLHAEDPTNEGIPCADCGHRQKRLNIWRETDGDLSVRINWRIPGPKLASEIKGLVTLLKRFATS